MLASLKSLGDVGLAVISRWLLNHYPELSEQELTFIYLWIAIFFIVFFVIRYFRFYLPLYISSNVIKELRQQLYRHLQRLSADFYIKHRTGEIISRMTNDISMSQLLFSGVIINLTFDLVSVIAVTGFILLTYPYQIYLPILGICACYGFFFKIFFPKIRERSTEVQKELGKITGDISEKIDGMKVLQSFTQEEIASHDIDERLESYYFETIRMAKVQSLFSSFVQFLPELTKVFVVVIGIYMITAVKMSLGDITGLILVLGPLFFSLKRTGDTTVQLGSSLGSLDRVFEFFDAQPSVIEAKDLVMLDRLDGRIVFQNVDFRYPQNSENLILKNISFSLASGAHVAFVGPSGAGKSTMMDLLSRFYDPTSGTILIDDVDIRKISLKLLRKNIGIVMQETILFSGTITENLRIGKPDADEKEIIEALKNAYAWDFVKQMPHGIHSVVGERGITLSGGQRQRLAIARVFLKNPRILILDEATSALDTESERYVQQAFQHLIEGRTTLVIAHRLSTIKDVGHIYVLENGRIIEDGSEDELLGKNKMFRRLYEKQTIPFTEV